MHLPRRQFRMLIATHRPIQHLATAIVGFLATTTILVHVITGMVAIGAILLFVELTGMARAITVADSIAVIGDVGKESNVGCIVTDAAPICFWTLSGDRRCGGLTSN
jgi:uncharacterized membrane protein